jgi:hypothetical protein
LIGIDHVLLAYSRKGGTPKPVSSGPVQVFYSRLVGEGRDVEVFIDLCKDALLTPRPSTKLD